MYKAWRSVDSCLRRCGLLLRLNSSQRVSTSRLSQLSFVAHEFYDALLEKINPPPYCGAQIVFNGCLLKTGAFTELPRAVVFLDLGPALTKWSNYFYSFPKNPVSDCPYFFSGFLMSV